jgi:hypothetical protein
LSRMASDTLSLYGGSSASFYDVKLVRSVKPVSVPVTNLSKKRTGRSLANTEARSVASQMTVKYTIMVSDGARIMMAPVTSGHWQVRVTSKASSLMFGLAPCDHWHWHPRAGNLPVKPPLAAPELRSWDRHGDAGEARPGPPGPGAQPDSDWSRTRTAQRPARRAAPPSGAGSWHSPNLQLGALKDGRICRGAPPASGRGGTCVGIIAGPGGPGHPSHHVLRVPPAPARLPAGSDESLPSAATS